VFLVEGLGCYAAAWSGGELLFTTKTTKATKGGVLLCVLSGGTWLLRAWLGGELLFTTKTMKTTKVRLLDGLCVLSDADPIERG